MVLDSGYFLSTFGKYILWCHKGQLYPQRDVCLGFCETSPSLNPLMFWVQSEISSFFELHIYLFLFEHVICDKENKSTIDRKREKEETFIILFTKFHSTLNQTDSINSGGTFQTSGLLDKKNSKIWLSLLVLKFAHRSRPSWNLLCHTEAVICCRQPICSNFCPLIVRINEGNLNGYK